MFRFLQNCENNEIQIFLMLPKHIYLHCDEQAWRTSLKKSYVNFLFEFEDIGPLDYWNKFKILK